MPANSTDTFFFDTDCLSAFLWVNEQSLLTTLYPGRVVIPEAVYQELSNPCTPHLKARIDILLSSQLAKLQALLVGTESYQLYREMTFAPRPGFPVIGKGEAAAIALAKEANGILASNNLRDVLGYVKLFSLRHVTTGDLLKEALDRQLITLVQGEQLWQKMLQKRRKLGYGSFADFLNARR